jgi:hypothetical protein
MTKDHAEKRRIRRNLVPRLTDPDRMLEILLAFDRSVVELSMGLYNLPRRERTLMRQHNRRLHRVLRKRLPRFLEPPANLG